MTRREYLVEGTTGVVELFQHKRGFWTARYITPHAGTIFATNIRVPTEEQAKAMVEAEGRNWTGEWQTTADKKST